MTQSSPDPFYAQIGDRVRVTANVRGTRYAAYAGQSGVIQEILGQRGDPVLVVEILTSGERIELVPSEAQNYSLSARQSPKRL